MNLNPRIERLERRMIPDMQAPELPVLWFRLVEPIRDENDKLIGERTAGYIEMAPFAHGRPGRIRRLDANMNPVGTGGNPA